MRHEPGLARTAAEGGRLPKLKLKGMALRFALIIADRRLRDAHLVSCELDTISVVFPELSLSIELSRLPLDPHGGFVLACSAEQRIDGGACRVRRTWRRTLIGGTSGAQQREAVVQEILAARARPHTRVTARPELHSLRVWAAAV